MEWLRKNWEKLFTILMSVIVAGLIGYYSSIIAIKTDINNLEKSILSQKIELGEKLETLNKKIDLKLLELNNAIEIDDRKKIEDIVRLKSEVNKDIVSLKTDLEKQIYFLQAELSMSVKPKLKQVDIYMEQIYEFKYELKNIKNKN